MSMQSYANMGHLLPFTKENMEKFGLSEEAAPLFDYMEQEGDEAAPQESMAWDARDAFIEAFEKKWGIAPIFEFLNEEVEGCAGSAEHGIFLYFEDDQKYIKTVRPEWEQLPIEPVVSSWTTFG